MVDKLSELRPNITKPGGSRTSAPGVITWETAISNSALICRKPYPGREDGSPWAWAAARAAPHSLIAYRINPLSRKTDCRAVAPPELPRPGRTRPVRQKLREISALTGQYAGPERTIQRLLAGKVLLTEKVLYPSVVVLQRRKTRTDEILVEHASMRWRCSPRGTPYL